MTDDLDELLAHPSTWAEPSDGLEDDVVRAVLGGTALVEPTLPRRRWFIAVSGVAAAAAVVAFTLVGSSGPGVDYEADLTASSAALGAVGSADVVRNAGGFRITLDASGLPTLADGDYYQAWLKDSAGTLVPVGTFSSSDAEVTLWSGVSPSDFPLLTITIESTGNDQSSSGRLVLSGRVESR